MPATVLTYTVPGDPVAWARARLSGTRHFTAPAQREYKAVVASLARRAMAGRPPAADAVALRVVACFTPPASWSRAKRAQALAGELRPKVKPDWDNLGKIVSDAMNGVVYLDDAQIVDASVGKRYAEQAGVAVEVHWGSGQ